jgi:murein DD-endopeptidase MepM/ murein hydrolase activator NlpD
LNEYREIHGFGRKDNMSERTFKLGDKGKDVKAFQQTLVREFKHLNLNPPIVVDGIFGHHTRVYTAALLRARGILTKAMEHGVTYELRKKIHDRVMTKAEKKRFHSKARQALRAHLREQWKTKKVHAPVSTIIADSWGYHPGVHDGIDVICKPNAACFAMVKSKVIDVRAGGWWGKAPSGDVAKGDGIVQLEVLENVGPFKKGMHIGYGHCESARVRVGQVVEAGEVIALAGLAVAWHIHLMMNSGGTTKGVGTMDPRKFLDYAVKNG